MKNSKQEKPTASSLVKTVGGSWLGALRSWIQWNCRNGSQVGWGSQDFLEMKSVTVNEMENLSGSIIHALMSNKFELKRMIELYYPDGFVKKEAKMTNLDKFFDIYRVKLFESIQADPATYGFSDGSTDETYQAWAETVCARMKAATRAGTFNHDGPAFRATCKALGIKSTRKSIIAFIGG